MFDKLKSILNQEINKVSTVPVVFGEEDVLFAGNFSDFNLVSVLDMTNLSINEIGTLSDVKHLDNLSIFIYDSGGLIDLTIHFCSGEE